MLPKRILDAFTEIGHFFRDICSGKLHTHHIDRLEMNIVKTICKLEIIFPLLFFDSMKYLLIYLLYEAEVGGSIQYRWMYPFKRLDITNAMYC